MHFVLIDGSYYIFFRYHALLNWWQHAKPADTVSDPSTEDEFVKKFQTTFVSKLNEIPKKLGLTGTIVTMVGRDCPRSEIWRNNYTNEYKAGRKNSDVGKFFHMSYENLFAEAGIQTILSYPCLEADDCIAITTKHIINTYPEAQVWIITSDMDYLQLAVPRVNIVNLKYTKLVTSKNSFQDPEKDLFCKIVCGDKSDNIAPVLPRCGLRTAASYYDNKEKFEKKLDSVPGARAKYENNKRLISFDYIPEELVNGFRRECLRL